MKSKIVFIACCVLIMSLLGCGSAPKKKEAVKSRISSPDQALKMIEDGQNEKALAALDDFLKSSPVSPSTPMVLFAQGLALNELGRFAEASQKFNTVIKLNGSKDKYLEAESLYQMGRSYEGQGDDAKALATWFDADRRSKFLSKEIAEVELPARVAGVYARKSQMSDADQYYARADAGFAKLRGNKKIQKQEWISKALYSMGKISPRAVSWPDFESGLKTIRRSQSYLLRAVEIGHPRWAERSETELEFIYGSAWETLESYPVQESDDKLASLKVQQDKMTELGLVLNGALVQLKQEFLPDGENENFARAKLKDFLASYERKLDALINKRPVNEGLTPEALQKEGIVRDGRVVDPSGKLESKTEVAKPVVKEKKALSKSPEKKQKIQPLPKKAAVE